jgi:hypothetical protein
VHHRGKRALDWLGSELRDVSPVVIGPETNAAAVRLSVSSSFFLARHEPGLPSPPQPKVSRE